MESIAGTDEKNRSTNEPRGTHCIDRGKQSTERHCPAKNPGVMAKVERDTARVDEETGGRYSGEAGWKEKAGPARLF